MDAEPAKTRNDVRTDGAGDGRAGATGGATGDGPAGDLAALLARAENGEQAAPHLAGVRAALMHHSGLQSCRHTKGPPRQLSRRTYRHSFLLPDGGVRMVWELEHNTGPDGAVRHAVFVDREDLAVAEWEVDTAFGAWGGPVELPPNLERSWPPAESAPHAEHADHAGRPEYGDGRLHGVGDPSAGGSDARDGTGGVVGAGGREAFRRAYTEGDSAEHAWRLLRRATNPGAPGDDVRDLLRASIAYGISIAARRSTVVAGRMVSWTLYEHAFLLLDGGELSLWEIDHTRTPNGDPVCEVYASRDAALDTAVRRIEAG